MKPILEIENLSKKFRIHHVAGGYLSLRERVGSTFKSKKDTEEDFWALKDISFSVNKGESVGIIGRNGAGKSTLLKILSNITPPTKGKVTIRGRIASLLEVGTGFHPELTGRENIFFNGSLLGMKKQEIESKFDAILDFSGVEKFLDTTLKHYSSGMQLHLTFSVAAFLEPEILIIDEVLAVGDAEFQKKCLGKMEDVSKSGRTILFVSHNMAATENLCRSGILLDKGGVAFRGSMSEVISVYQTSINTKNETTWSPSGPKKEVLYFKHIALELTGTQPHLKLKISCTLASNTRHKDALLAIDILNSMGLTVMQAIPVNEPYIKYSETDQLYVVDIELPPVIPDTYKVSIWVGAHNTETFCWEKEVLGFEVYESPTKGRNYPHDRNHGFVVPLSTVTNL